MDPLIVHALKDLSFADGDDDSDDDWLQACLISLSPFGNVVVLAHKLKLAFLSKKKGGSLAPRVFDRCWPGLEGDRATAAVCLPVADSRPGRRSAGAPLLWHCAVVGYSSGSVEVVSEEGDCLARRRPMETPVRSLRSSVSSTIGLPRLDGTVSVEKVPAVADVLVVYDSSLVTLTGSPLSETLWENRRRAAEARAAGQEGLEEEVLAGLFCKRFHFREQSATDACVLKCPNRDFDRLCHLSLDSKINETHFRSLSSLTYIVSVGSDPWLQYNLPYNYKQPDINELAENVVSTVKSGLFRAATGMIFGGGGGGGGEKKQDEEKKPREPEQKLVVSHQLVDPTKSASSVELSPNNLHLAVVDNKNRVLVVDALSGTVVSVWKGYHHVQVGWLVVSSKEMPTDACDPFPADNRTCCLLVIYLPRRGSLEVCSAERKVRIAEFSVSRQGRLVRAHNGVLDATGQALYSRTAPTCHFMDGSGKLFRIVVPFHSIMTQSAASHDLVQQQKLSFLLKDSGAGGGASFDEALYLISGGRTVSGRLAMLVDFLNGPGVSSEDGRKMMVRLQETAAGLPREVESEGHNPLSSFADQLCLALDLYDLLAKSSGESFSSEPEKQEDLAKKESTLMKWTEEIEDDAKPVLGALNLQNFLDWFEISPDVVSTGGEGKVIAVKKAPLQPERSGAIFTPFAMACRREHHGLLRLVRRLEITSVDLLRLMVEAVPLWDRKTAAGIGPLLGDVFSLIFSVDEGQDVNMVRLELVGKARTIMAEAGVSPQLYLLLYHFHCSVMRDGALGRLCSRETDMLVDSCGSFLHVRRHFGQLLTGTGREPMTWGGLSVRSVFDEGNGRVPELIAKWLVEKGFGADDVLRSPEVGDFLEACSQHYPRSARTKVVLSHLAWEMAHQWARRRTRLDLLKGSAQCLNGLLDELEEPRLAHSVAVLIWKTFLSSAVRDATNHIENRFTASRCLREVGLPPADLPELLLTCAKVVRLILNSDSGVWDGQQEAEEAAACYYYDEHASFEQHRRHLLDHVSDPRLRRFDSESMALHYQFAICCCLILRFELDLRPLRLFSHQETNHFFQDGGGGEGGGGGGGRFGLNLGMLSVMKVGSAKKYRYQLIRGATTGAVACIHYTGPGKVDTDEYKDWAAQLVFLGKLWHLSEEVCGALVISLYREGHDALTGELFRSSARQADVAEELLLVAMARLSKHLHESTDYKKKVARVKEYLLDKLHALQQEAASMPEVSLEQTESLLVTVCESGISDANARVAEDCLALARIFARQ